MEILKYVLRKNETSIPLVYHGLGNGIEDKCFSCGGTGNGRHSV